MRWGQPRTNEHPPDSPNLLTGRVSRDEAIAHVPRTHARSSKVAVFWRSAISTQSIPADSITSARKSLLHYLEAGRMVSLWADGW
jgi:hypothetical protein